MTQKGSPIMLDDACGGGVGGFQKKNGWALDWTVFWAGTVSS